MPKPWLLLRILVTLALSGAAMARAESVPSVDAPASVSTTRKKDSAVVVGVEKVPGACGHAVAGADATAFASWFKARGIPPARVRLLVDSDEAATRAAVRAATEEVRETLWVVVIGCGRVSDEGLLLVTSGGTPEAPAGVPLPKLLDAGRGSRAKRIVVVLDVDAGSGVGFAVPTDPRFVVWRARPQGEPALVWNAAGHGIFAWSALGALQGWADGEFGAADGVVTLEEAQAYTSRVAKSLSGGVMRPERDARADVKRLPLAKGGLVKGPTADELVGLARLARAERVHAAEADVRALATMEWDALQPSTQARSPAAIASLQAFAAKWDSFTVTVDGQALGVAIPEVGLSRERLDAWSRATRKGKRGKKRAAAPPPPTPSAMAACKDPVALEPRAIAGELTDEDRTCLEARIAGEKKQTAKDKLSRLLLVDADARGDKARWATLMVRHLDAIDRSDPDLCMRWAQHLARGDIDDAEASLYWADVALENKHAWEGPRHVSRVYGLLQLRAEVSHRPWADSEADFQAERSDENMDEAEVWRGRARTASREWLDQARGSGQDTSRARVLCESAAGAVEYCPR